MSFLKRFGYYLIGLSVGLIFLAVFLRKKSESTGTEFCYLPNCRVLKALRSKPLQFEPNLKSIADSTKVIFLLKEGDVDFGDSEPRAKPCGIFVVRGNIGGANIQMTLQNCEEITKITGYKESEK
jgi:hypothetical protein